MLTWNSGFLFRIIMAVFVVVSIQIPTYAAYTINSLNCTSTYIDNVGPPFTREFNDSCTASATTGPSRDYKLVIQAPSSTTTKISGNGSDLNYTTKNRFKVQGPNPAPLVDVPVTSSYVVIDDSFAKNKTFNVTFDLFYTTYEADYGGTSYLQNLTLLLMDKNETSSADTYYGSMTFTVPNKASISLLGNPAITYTSSADVFTPTFYKESNTVTVSVKANNQWTLQAKMDRAPKDDVTLLELPISNNYFKASGVGFSNLASSYTQFSSANTYFNIAQNSSGIYTTGSSDGENLNSIDVTFTYKLENNSSAYNQSTYTSNLFYNIVGSWE